MSTSAGATFDLDLDIVATFQDPGGPNNRITVTELGTIGDVVPATAIALTNDSVDIVIPVEVKPTTYTGFDGAFSSLSPSPQIKLTTNSLYDSAVKPLNPAESEDPRTALRMELDDFDALKPFRNIDDTSVVSILQGIGTF